MNSNSGSNENLLDYDDSSRVSSTIPDYDKEDNVLIDVDEPIEPIYSQFKKYDDELRELMSKPPSTTGWNPVRFVFCFIYYN